MTWMPSCELPAMRMTASLILETFGVPPDNASVAFVLLMNLKVNNFRGAKQTSTEDESARRHCPTKVSHE
jgi:hypothetical protein